MKTSKLFSFFAALMLTIISPHTINAMGGDLIYENLMISDLRIYQFLSSAIENNPEFYLPKELTQTIIILFHKITESHYYKKYGACLNSVDSLLNFIKNQSAHKVDIEWTINTLKACLHSSSKSLCTIQVNNNTALHRAIINYRFNGYFCDAIDWRYCIDTLCQAVEKKDLMSFLCAQDYRGWTVLHYTANEGYDDIVKKLIAMADNKASELIAIKSHEGEMALDIVKTTSILLSNFISNLNYDITPQHWDRLYRLKITIKLLKSYCKIEDEKTI